MAVKGTIPLTRLQPVAIHPSKSIAPGCHRQSCLDLALLRNNWENP